MAVLLGVWESTPCFEDPNLRIPSAPHRLSCPALGPVPKACRCGTPGPFVEPQALTVLDKEGLAARVQAAGWSAVYIEHELLRPWRISSTVDAPRSAGPPSDALELQAWLTEHGRPTIGRRRKHPRLGELVWIRDVFRSQAKDVIPTPWRLFTRTPVEALLVDPMVPWAKLTEAHGDEVKRLPLHGKALNQILMPVTPLHR